MSEGTLIVALGTRLRGDDGVGEAVLQALSSQDALPNHVKLSHQGINGLLGVLYGERYQRIIVVDAAHMGCHPGEWIRFTPADARLGLYSGKSWHGVGLAEILALAESLKVKPPDIVIYGVEPLTMEHQSGLSDVVKRAVPDICTAILAEVSSLPNKGRKYDGKDTGD